MAEVNPEEPCHSQIYGAHFGLKRRGRVLRRYAAPAGEFMFLISLFKKKFLIVRKTGGDD